MDAIQSDLSQPPLQGQWLTPPSLQGKGVGGLGLYWTSIEKHYIYGAGVATDLSPVLLILPITHLDE
ncbi:MULTISPECIES: hypothetical protein [Cyanophyceae]|uniref:hypothetical protein n=1 Tax=Cyanophyceae TaxID=3028117 RepID=UPI0016826F1E|nr:hypothetical protein [Trichocoleus sp. FACHB-40]MBD2004023.1 hypothetical protein [Trichocoleus sp. FACHB-40]